MYEDDNDIKLNRKMRAIASALASVLFLVFGAILMIILFVHGSLYAFPFMYFMVFMSFVVVTHITKSLIAMLLASGAAISALSSLAFGLTGFLAMPNKLHDPTQSLVSLMIGIMGMIVFGILGWVFIVIYRFQLKR